MRNVFLSHKPKPILFFEIFIREFFELVKLNFLFLIACLPIITIPAAYTAMNRIIVTMVRDRNHFLWYDFWKSFRSEFVKSMVIGWPLSIMEISCGFCTFFFGMQGKNNIFFLFPAIISLLLFLSLKLCKYYLFPLLAAVNLSAFDVVKNSILLTFVCFPYNLSVLILVGIFWFAWLIFLPESFSLIFILLFSFSDFLSSFCVWDSIQKYILEETFIEETL